jgi:hypothetical protein
MRFTFLLTALIFTGLVMYAKLMAIAEAPTHVYPAPDSGRFARNSSHTPVATSVLPQMD